MTDYNIETDNLLLDFESFSATGIELTPQQIGQAAVLSDRIIDTEEQWQTYLNALALFGFQTWLEERDNSLVMDTSNCSLMQPSLANYINGVFNLTIGEYKLCLLTNGVAIDEFISIDRALIELPEYTPHLYIVVNVIEERSEVEIASFIPYNELIQRRQTANLTADADWTYQIPLAWFHAQPDDILLYLRCLEPSAIALPTPIAVNIQPSDLESLIPQLQSGIPLPEILTWERAIPILSNPSLLQWLYELQTTQPTTRDALNTLGDRLSDTIAGVTQTAINVRAWLNDELDALAQLAWTLLPAPAYAPSGLRDLEVLNRESPAAEFEAIITQLRNSGEDIPTEARGAFHDFSLGSQGMRLFALIWEVSETEVPEWSLLIVLGARVNNYLPQGSKLEVREGDTVLDEKIIAEDTADSYLYTQVIGELDEQFTVTITLANGETITFPNFVFD
jgi:hypothetical protein